MKKACVRSCLPYGLLPSLLVSAICCLVDGQAAASGVSTDPVFGVLPRSDEVVSDKTLRLSLDEAVELFLRRNLDLLIARFGIAMSKAQEVTARLFPNPVVSIGMVSSPVDGRTLSNSGQLYPQIQQLFELAGKRGYRIEGTEFGTQSAEAGFEDAVRQLGFAVKDAYYRVQLARRRLTLAEENKERFSRILEVNTIRFKKGFIAEIELIRIRLQYIDFQSQVIQALQEVESAQSDLRQLLRVSPTTD
ncbi:MAG: TolC family protein, partial [Nitrospira sp.]|nr:TolC family protein [Nitrospira sp.]